MTGVPRSSGRLSSSTGRPDEVGDRTDPVDCSHTQPCLVEDPEQAGLGEPPRQRVTRSPPAVRVLERVACLGEVAGHSAGEDHGVAGGHQDAEGAARAQDLDEGEHGGCDVVDVLEDAVAEDEVGRAGPDDVEQPGGVTLHRAHLDTCLAGPSLERGERIGAGVDDGDPVAQPRDRHREASGAASHVEHVEPAGAAGAAGPGGEDATEGVPHHGGTGGTRRGRAVCGWHPVSLLSSQVMIGR